jgi:hypothetical protein
MSLTSLVTHDLAHANPALSMILKKLLKQSVAVNLRPQIGVMVTQATHAESEKHRPLLSNGEFQTDECGAQV